MRLNYTHIWASLWNRLDHIKYAALCFNKCFLIIRFFEKFQNFGFYGHFYPFKKQKRCFWNFWGQNHEISKIRDSHLVELVILRLTWVLFAYPFNSLPFMDSQTIVTFGSEIACSDVTKTLIAPRFSVRFFWNFVRRWSIQFLTASRSLARLRRPKPEL